ncbi:MAG: hypothetical protein GY866_12855 [Proteobacteria bacterium]|nr:hypothetical protein [Pseudomonadota bacterium]
MKDDPIAAELIGELEKNRAILQKIDRFHDDFMAGDLKKLGRVTSTAIVMAEIFVDFYTCLETLFLRISRFFENRLQQDKWHSDLLHKMTLSIKEIRPAVITDRTFNLLNEFLKFRHFRRYYFEFEYDWDKIDYLERKYQQVKSLLKNDLDSFHHFLDRIDQEK